MFPRSGLLRYLIMAAAVIPALVGCGDTRVVLWTDRPDSAPIVELFNHEQDQYVVELRYDRDIDAALRLESTNADLVIARSIEDRETSGLFHSLDRLMQRGVDPDDFYQPLLENGARSGRQRLLPLSFNLPLVFFADDSVADPDEITISPDEMRAAGSGFNTIADDLADRLAFSPLWDPAFLYELVRIAGFTVSEGADGEPTWSLADLLAGLSFALEWIESDNAGLSVDSAFQDQYLYDPIIRLVQRGRILFGFDNSENYLRRSDASRSGLSIRWFGLNESINVIESIVYVGIPVSAKNRDGAEAFVTWLFNESTQEMILANNHQKRVDSFAVAGGLSSLWRVTERMIPDVYPELTSMIPPASWLTFPGPLPRHWASAIEPVVQQWMLREISGQSQARDLDSTVSAWLLQQGE